MTTTQSPAVDQRPELELRAYMLERLPIEHAPAHLRLAFHDAGTYDVKTHSGGAHGAIHLLEEVARAENVGWGATCLDLLAQVKAVYPQLSWADLVAVSGAVAVEKCGGPLITVGLGRLDASEPAPEHRLPTTDEGAAQLKSHFERMGLGPQELVALSGGHTLGKVGSLPFTSDPYVFDSAYFVHLMAGDADSDLGLLDSDRALLDDPDLRIYVELYARDQPRFLTDFAEAYRRLTWLGGELPGG